MSSRESGPPGGAAADCPGELMEPSPLLLVPVSEWLAGECISSAVKCYV